MYIPDTRLNATYYELSQDLKGHLYMYLLMAGNK